MSKLNQLNCSQFNKNTGFAACYLDWKTIRGAFIYTSPRIFSAAEIANLLVTLTNDAATDTKSLRAYPVHNFVSLTDNTEDVVVQTFDYGAKAIVRDGDYDWTAEFQDGGACLTNSLRTLNGKQYVLFYDAENKILGQNFGGQFATIPLQFLYAKPFKTATGSTAANYGVRFVFNAKYGAEASAVVKAGFDLGEVNGLQDLVLQKNGFNKATGMLNVSIVTDCGASDLYGAYSAGFVAAVFNAFNSATGGGITVTSVTPIPGSSSFNIQLNRADPDWPASGTITIQLSAPSVLGSHNIVGYEGLPLLVDVSGS
jgi:hypothetical protein